MMQGSIYIYAMDGAPLVTGKSAQAMAINSKIGIVTGLTLDPIKKVTQVWSECSAEVWPLFVQLVFWSDETSAALRYCSYTADDCGIIASTQQQRPSGEPILFSMLRSAL